MKQRGFSSFWKTAWLTGPRGASASCHDINTGKTPAWFYRCAFNITFNFHRCKRGIWPVILEINTVNDCWLVVEWFIWKNLGQNAHRNVNIMKYYYYLCFWRMFTNRLYGIWFVPFAAMTLAYANCSPWFGNLSYRPSIPPLYPLVLFRVGGFWSLFWKL